MEDVAHPIIRSSTPVRVFHNPDDVAGVVHFPDRRRMATNSKDGFLRVWDLKDGVMLKEMDARGEAMRDIALSQDGQLIASCDYGGYVIAWRGDTLTEVFRNQSGAAACSLDFSPDGATLATGSYGSITLWNTKSWQLRGEQIDTKSRESIYTPITGCNLHCVRYSPSGELLAIATERNIQIWDIVMRRRITILDQGHTHSLAWMPDGTRLLSAGNPNVREWDSSTWKEVGCSDLWKGDTSSSCQCIAINYNGTLVAYQTTNDHVRLWRPSDRRTIAIFQHSDSPCCISFSVDGKRILAGGKDKKISEWAVPEHAWPDSKNAPKYQSAKAQDHDTESQDCDTESQNSEGRIVAMKMKVRNACISGDLPAAEELLTQEINAKGDHYRSYANRSIVMARKLYWDRALEDATTSLSIRPSLIGYISKGIALCGKKQARNANKAFDLASTFTDGDPQTIHFLFLVKAMALFSANQHADAIRRVRELATACPNADTALMCRIVEVYLHIQLGNNALDRARPAEAADHFTTAVNTGTFLAKFVTYSKYEDFAVLFGCDFTSLWQSANQKRCHALLQAGRLVEVFEACRYMADMSDETMKASCLNWAIGFMPELSAFQGSALDADANPDICKYYDVSDSISEIDSDGDSDY